jgi:Zn-dependent protease with chaperone function
MTHALLLGIGFGLALAAGTAGALALRLVRSGAGRAPALAVLGLPAVILGFTSVHLIPAFWAECTPLTGPDAAVIAGWSVLAAGSAVAGLIAGLRRLLLADGLLRRVPVLTGHPVAEKVGVLAGRLGIVPPVVRVLELDRPLVVSGGVRQTAVVISRWVLEHLDESELEAVAAHELAHLARRSQAVLWLGRLLQDGLWYVPSGRYALRVLARDEELAADELTVRLTGRPLALAGALGKVWAGSSGPLAAGLSGLIGEEGDAGGMLEVRLVRLLADGTDKQSAARALVLTVPGLLTAASWQVLELAAEALPLVCRLGSL